MHAKKSHYGTGLQPQINVQQKIPKPPNDGTKDEVKIKTDNSQLTSVI